MALEALGGLSQAVPSLPRDTCQGLSAGRMHTPGRRQNVLKLSSPGHLLVEWKTSCSLLTSPEDSDTQRRMHGSANFLVQKCFDL